MSPLHKYAVLLQLSWQNQFVYRTSLFMWRLRQFLSSMMSLTIWSVLFASQTSIFNYNQQQMISYVFLISFLQSVVLTTALHGLANDIYSGAISSLMTKPLNIFAYLATQDAADKLKNIFFVIFEVALLAWIFKPVVTLPSMTMLGLFLLSVILGVVLYFLVIMLFGTLGFWSPETWGPRFLFFMVLDFSAGKLFPLDILPRSIQDILYLTPFPYFSYAQIQIFLEKYSYAQALTTIGVISVWAVFLGLGLAFVWRKGIKNYAAAGI
jgi:ABC-2 type transport system permease protein